MENFENMKKCKVLGFGKYPNKDTGEMMLRILIGINSSHENYYGLMIAPAVFIKYNEELEENLKNCINDPEKYECYYTTTDNIISGKTKVNAIYVESKYIESKIERD